MISNACMASNVQSSGHCGSEEKIGTYMHDGMVGEECQ